MDLNQSALYNLYTNGNMNCLSLVQSANLLGIKDIADVEPSLQPTFAFTGPFQRIDLEQALVKPNGETMVFSSDNQSSPPTINNELLNLCENPLQNNLIFQMMPPSSSSTNNSDLLSLQLQMSNSCDSDGSSFSSSHSMTNETPKLTLNNNNAPREKKRKELIRDEAYWERRRK